MKNKQRFPRGGWYGLLKKKQRFPRGNWEERKKVPLGEPPEETVQENLLRKKVFRSSLYSGPTSSLYSGEHLFEKRGQSEEAVVSVYLSCPY